MNANKTDRQELIKTLGILKSKYEVAMRGRMVPSAQAMKIKREIAEVQRVLDAINREAAERLALEKAPVDDVLEVIAIPLLADVMNDLVAGVDAMLRRNGCQGTVFGDYTRRIRRDTMAIVNTLDHADSNLPRLLEVDDALVDAVKKKIMSFIKQRLNITQK